MGLFGKSSGAKGKRSDKSSSSSIDVPGANSQEIADLAQNVLHAMIQPIRVGLLQGAKAMNELVAVDAERASNAVWAQEVTDLLPRLERAAAEAERAKGVPILGSVTQSALDILQAHVQEVVGRFPNLSDDMAANEVAKIVQTTRENTRNSITSSSTPKPFLSHDPAPISAMETDRTGQASTTEESSVIEVETTEAPAETEAGSCKEAPSKVTDDVFNDPLPMKAEEASGSPDPSAVPISAPLLQSAGKKVAFPAVALSQLGRTTFDSDNDGIDDDDELEPDEGDVLADVQVMRTSRPKTRGSKKKRRSKKNRR